MGTKYIDLHLHLDGAITAEAAMELAKVQGISLPARRRCSLRGIIWSCSGERGRVESR